MISHTTTPTIRKSAAIIGVAGILALAGCSDAAEADTQTDNATTDSSASDSSSTESSSGYADGTYTAAGAYQTPRPSNSSASAA